MKTKNLILLTIYGPPKKVTAHYQLFLEEKLTHLSNWALLQHQSTAIVSNLNLNRLNTDNAEGKTLLNLEIEKGLECVINSPTRVQMQRACVTKILINVILTNRPELFSSCGMYNPEMSDHALIYGFIKEKVKPKKDRIIRSKRNFDKQHPEEDLCHAPLHVGNTFDTVDDKAGF